MRPAYPESGGANEDAASVGPPVLCGDAVATLRPVCADRDHLETVVAAFERAHRARRGLNRGGEDRRERPEEQGEVRKDEVGAQPALPAGALEHLFEEPAELLAGGCKLACAGEIAHERVFQDMVGGLELECPLEQE